MDKDGYTYFDKDKIALEEVLPKLQQIYKTNPEAKIFIRGDREAVHGNVTRVLDQIRSSGFTKISFEIKSQAAAGVPGSRKVKQYAWTTSLSPAAEVAGLGSSRWRGRDSFCGGGDCFHPSQGAVVEDLSQIPEASGRVVH